MRTLLLLVSLLPLLAFAQSIELLALKHRSAAEIMPLLEPLLKEDEAVSGINYQLILRANPQQIIRIKALINQLDVKPENLLITVIQDVDQETARQWMTLNGQITISNKGNQATVNMDIHSNRSLKNSQKQQQLRVLEGHRALIQSGQQQPVRERWLDHRGRIIERNYYQQANSGFYVLPRLNGEQVQLEIYAQDDEFQQHQLQTHQVQSQISGFLGQWLVLGELQQQTATQENGLSAYGNSQLNTQRITLIKVERAD